MELFLWCIGLVALLLSYEMPIYAARLLGLETNLNWIWYSVDQDGAATKVIVFCLYMIVGFALWAGPVAFVVTFLHPQWGILLRQRTGRFFGLLLIPAMPVLT